MTRGERDPKQGQASDTEGVDIAAMLDEADQRTSYTSSGPLPAVAHDTKPPATASDRAYGASPAAAPAAEVTEKDVQKLMDQAHSDPQQFGRLLARMPPAKREAYLVTSGSMWGSEFVDLIYQSAYPTAHAVDTGYAAASQGSSEGGFFGGETLLNQQQLEYMHAMTAGEPGHAPTGAEEAHKLALTTRTLTAQDRANVVSAQQQVAGLKPERIDDPKNPNLVQIMIAFDGTGNNKDVDSWQTGPARLWDHFQGPRLYARGVATRGDTPNYYAEGATGVGINARVNEVYEGLVNKINAIKSEKPDAEIVLVITGFSRGSATARIFANELNKRGIPVRDEHGKAVHNSDGKVKKYDTPEIGVMMLFDTVYSYVGENGIPLTLDQALFSEFAGGKSTPVPDNVHNVAHFTAADEHRITFPLRHIQDPAHPHKNWHEIALPGAHSDVGGGYPNHYSDISYRMAYDYLVNAGVSMRSDDTPRVDVNDPTLRLTDSGGVMPGTSMHFARRHQY